MLLSSALLLRHTTWSIISVHKGSALNVFKNEQNKTDAFMVYGFSDSKVRVWVDSSKNGGKQLFIYGYDILLANILLETKLIRL